MEDFIRGLPWWAPAALYALGFLGMFLLFAPAALLSRGSSSASVLARIVVGLLVAAFWFVAFPLISLGTGVDRYRKWRRLRKLEPNFPMFTYSLAAANRRTRGRFSKTDD